MTTTFLTTHFTTRIIPASAARIARAPSDRERIRVPAAGRDSRRPNAACTLLTLCRARLPQVHRKPPSSATNSKERSPRLAEGAGDPSPVACGFWLRKKDCVQPLHRLFDLRFLH